MPAALDGKGQGVIDLGTCIVFIGSQFCECRGYVEDGEGLGGRTQIITGGDGEGAEPVKDFQFQSQRAIGPDMVLLFGSGATV